LDVDIGNYEAISSELKAIAGGTRAWVKTEDSLTDEVSAVLVEVIEVLLSDAATHA